MPATMRFGAELDGPDAAPVLACRGAAGAHAASVMHSMLATRLVTPMRLDITSAAKLGKNQLAVHVTNFWPNRIIGDQLVRDSERVTQTNIRKLTSNTPLMTSGLLGPVRILTVLEQPLQF